MPTATNLHISSDLQPGPQLYAEARAAFILKGTTLHRWCLENDIRREHSRAVLMGMWNGPKGRQVRQRILLAAGLLRKSGNE